MGKSNLKAQIPRPTSTKEINKHYEFYRPVEHQAGEVSKSSEDGTKCQERSYDYTYKSQFSDKESTVLSSEYHAISTTPLRTSYHTESKLVASFAKSYRTFLIFVTIERIPKPDSKVAPRRQSSEISDSSPILCPESKKSAYLGSSKYLKPAPGKKNHRSISRENLRRVSNTKL